MNSRHNLEAYASWFHPTLRLNVWALGTERRKDKIYISTLLILKLRQHPDASADAAVTCSSQNNCHVEAVDVTKIKGICICEWH